MSSGWRSARLVYRALNDNGADDAFVRDAVLGDPAVFPLAYPEAFRPQSEAMAAGLCTQLRNKYLSVVICLPGEEHPRCSDPHGGPATADNGHGTQRGEGSRPIGTLTLAAAEPENHHHRKTMLGIIIITAYQGRGYGPEAINWGLDWAFKFGGMHRVGLTCYTFNERALRMYERLGFTKEGTVRDSVWFNRAWHDEVYYGMLESEWEILRSKQDLPKKLA